MNLLIKNAHLMDPSTLTNQRMDLLIQEGIITQMGYMLKIDPPMQVIDAQGQVLLPGLFDMHVHLRDPGYTHKEDMYSGTLAAARGGVTGVLAMPNTQPVVSSKKIVKDIQALILEKALVDVKLSGSITVDLEGLKLSDIEGMMEAGIIAVTDDGRTTMSEKLMKEMMVKMQAKDLVLISHAEDHDLVKGGAVHEGQVSQLLGIKGIPAQAEYDIVRRDIRLAKETGARLHIAHISTLESVEAVRQAKKEGLPITAEAGPHHFILTDEVLKSAGTLAKVNPPIRSEAHRKAVEEGLLDGTIDCIATDHAPHTLKEKDNDFYQAPFGISGVELSLSLSYTHLVQTGLMSWFDLITKMAISPRKILNLEVPRLAVGQAANLVLFDPRVNRMVSHDKMVSRGHNTPYEGMSLRGDVTLTLLHDKILYRGE